MIGVKRREGESVNSLVFRFVKRVRQSGVLIEARKRRFRARPINRAKRRASAIYRAGRRKEIEAQRKFAR